ncbi:MAG TPA: hypothetical protein VFO58_11330 [Vicinamibacterales bacterium]|nr:hypothetical protein [Vicinamibacterales bacterium]
MTNEVPKEYIREVSETGDVAGVNNAWDLIGRSRLNTLVIGPPAFTQYLVDSLRPRFATPVVRVRAAEPITLPVEEQVGTMILQDIDELRLTDQHRLDWLDSASRRPRLVSTAPQPIIAKVAEGAFLPLLYYRLNLFYVDAAEGGNSGGDVNLLM